MWALVAGLAVLPDDVCDQLGGGGGHAAAVAALQPTEPVDQFLRGLIQQKLCNDPHFRNQSVTLSSCLKVKGAA